MPKGSLKGSTEENESLSVKEVTQVGILFYLSTVFNFIFKSLQGKLFLSPHSCITSKSLCLLLSTCSFKSLGCEIQTAPKNTAKKGGETKKM